MDSISSDLVKVFSDSAAHKAVADIIVKHLSNKRDVRAEALDALDLSACRTILDLGCGFGFFTLGLQKRIAPDARITGIDCHSSYSDLYLATCKHIGIKGDFRPYGIQAIRSLPANSFDLVICSYGLYYFPGYINQIARILHPDGTFVTITHSRSHLKELITFVKRILSKNNISSHDPLPCEDLISNFSNENGYGLLSKAFRKVSSSAYQGKLIFQKKDFDSFKKYFLFKRIFFIPRNQYNEDTLTATILDELKQHIMIHGKISITIDDVIFICSDPVK